MNLGEKVRERESGREKVRESERERESAKEKEIVKVGNQGREKEGDNVETEI